MNYALVEDGVVTNIIWLHPKNAGDFPGAVPMGDTPVAIGDTWDGEHFWRGGKRVLTRMEAVQAELDEANATIAELDAALLDAAYENIMGTL